MLMRFERRARRFTVGDRVIVICAVYNGMGVTLTGDARVARITRTRYHVTIPGYATPATFDAATGLSSRGYSAISSVEEAEEQRAAFLASRGGPWQGSATLRCGEGEY